MDSTADILRFLYAGDAIFTIQSGKSGTHFTYNVEKSKPSPQYPKPIWFVGVLTGPDNMHDYTYMGTLKENGDVYTKDRQPPPSMVAFIWFLRQLHSGPTLPSIVKFNHMGRCGRCKRQLTTPESVESGIGPECAKKMGAG